MTRNRKYDYEIIKREYIYDAGSPPISYTDLADKYGMSRSLLTDRGAREDWTGQRRTFRETLGIKTTEAMLDELTKFQIATRERIMSVGLEYLAQYEKALKSGEIKVSTRDMLGIAGMVRTFTADAAAERQPGEEGLLNEDTPMSIDAIRRGLAMLESGEVDPADGQGDAPSEPPEAVGED